MRLETERWKKYRLGRDGGLFRVVYGVNLEFSNCEETTEEDPDGVAFVSRTESGNGVSGFVKTVEGVRPQLKGTITVAGGGSVLSTFLQVRDFYSGRDLFLLYPNDEISIWAKLFVITVLKSNKYRYNYGRQANATLPDLELALPAKSDGSPDWEWMENYIKSLHSKHLTTENPADETEDIKTENWSEFTIGDYFDIHPTKAYNGLSNKDLNDGGTTPFVVNTSINNGIGGFSTLDPTESGNKITFSDTTEGNTFFYQPADFIGFAHVQGLYENDKHSWTANQLLFLVSVLTFTCVGRYNYGRKMTRENIKATRVLLPSKDGVPDWEWMENYVKSLPYGDKLPVFQEEDDSKPLSS